jgi:hypothetical protein
LPGTNWVTRSRALALVIVSSSLGSDRSQGRARRAWSLHRSPHARLRPFAGEGVRPPTRGSSPPGSLCSRGPGPRSTCGDRATRARSQPLHVVRGDRPPGPPPAACPSLWAGTGQARQQRLRGRAGARPSGRPAGGDDGHPACHEVTAASGRDAAVTSRPLERYRRVARSGARRRGTARHPGRGARAPGASCALTPGSRRSGGATHQPAALERPSPSRSGVEGPPG